MIEIRFKKKKKTETFFLYCYDCQSLFNFPRLLTELPDFAMTSLTVFPSYFALTSLISNFVPTLLELHQF